MRDYLNEGGKAIVAGRNIHQWPTGGTGLTTTGPYDWAPDKLPGFFYPENNAGDDDLPGTAFQRYRDISNDTWQNYLGVVGRGTGSGYGASTYNGLAISPVDGEHLQRHGAVHAGRRLGQRPERGRQRHQRAAGEVPDAAAQLERHLAERAAAPGEDRARREHHADAGGRVRPVDGGHGGVRVRPRAGPDRDAQRAGRALAVAPAAHGGGHHGAVPGRVQVAGCRRVRGDDARPGGGRRDRRRRARRHEGGPPPGRRRARRHQVHVPVPVPLLPAGGGRRRDRDADRPGGGQRGQRRDGDADDRRLGGECRGRVAAPGRAGPGDRRRAGRGPHAGVLERLVAQRAGRVRLRVAPQRPADRGRHVRRRTRPRRATSASRSAAG